LERRHTAGEERDVDFLVGLMNGVRTTRPAIMTIFLKKDRTALYLQSLQIGPFAGRPNKTFS
jgi:hypothetical protein